jgi:hypothetical protein
MNANPKNSASSTKNAKYLSARTDLPSVHRERQSVMVPGEGQLPDVVVPLPQVVGAIAATGPVFRSLRAQLAKAQISCCNIRYNRI